jgi:hypothetical protein
VIYFIETRFGLSKGLGRWTIIAERNGRCREMLEDPQRAFDFLGHSSTVFLTNFPDLWVVNPFPMVLGAHQLPKSNSVLLNENPMHVPSTARKPAPSSSNP